MKVFYICDQKKCTKCNAHCSLTEDISHAKNFEKDALGNYVEKPEFIKQRKTKRRFQVELE